MKIEAYGIYLRLFPVIFIYGRFNQIIMDNTSQHSLCLISAKMFIINFVFDTSAQCNKYKSACRFAMTIALLLLPIYIA